MWPPLASFLLINPRSGKGSPTADELAAEARAAGVQTHVVQEGEDPAELARASAAEVFGVAGGDGSLAPVAEVALERDAAFVSIPFAHAGRPLGITIDGEAVESRLVLVANNANAVELPSLGERERLDERKLHVTRRAPIRRSASARASLSRPWRGDSRRRSTVSPTCWRRRWSSARSRARYACSCRRPRAAESTSG